MRVNASQMRCCISLRILYEHANIQTTMFYTRPWSRVVLLKDHNFVVLELPLFEQSKIKVLLSAPFQVTASSKYLAHNSLNPSGPQTNATVSSEEDACRRPSIISAFSLPRQPLHSSGGSLKTCVVEIRSSANEKGKCMSSTMSFSSRLNKKSFVSLKRIIANYYP